MFKRVIIFLFVIGVLSSCTTIRESKPSKNNNSIIMKKIRLLEARVEFNAQLIRINSQRINSIAFQIDKIKERLAKERKHDDNFISDIPPASLVDNLSKDVSSNPSRKVRAVENIVPAASSIKKSSININKKESKESKDKTVSRRKTGENYKKLYKEALSNYWKGNYRVASELFSEFLKKFKDNSLYDNSMYWLAYCYLHLKEKEKAITLLEKLVEKYPYASLSQGGKTDAALFTLFKIFKKEGNTMKAEYYRKLLFSRFPDSVFVNEIKKIWGE